MTIQDHSFFEEESVELGMGSHLCLYKFTNIFENNYAWQLQL